MAEPVNSYSTESRPSLAVQKRALYSTSRSVSSHALLSAKQLMSDDGETLSNKSGSLPVFQNEADHGRQAPASKDPESITIFEHLNRHASSLGLHTESFGSHNHTIIDIPNQQEMPHKSASLSWKKLHMLKPKLKTASNTSALMAGFAMAAVVEVQLSPDQIGPLPDALLIMFALSTSLLVSVQVLVLLISTCILPLMEGVCNLHSVSLVHESPHERLQRYIEFAWICSTILGILLFLLEVAVVCWVQFYNVLIAAAYVSTAVFLVFLCIFAWFAWIFYRSIATHEYESRQSDIRNLDKMRFHI